MLSGEIILLGEMAYIIHDIDHEEKELSKSELNEIIEKTRAECSCDPLSLIGNEIQSGTVYISTSKKASNLAKYIFLGLSVLLNVLLIWRK